MWALQPLFYPSFILDMIYLKGSRKHPVTSQKMDPLPNPADLNYLPQRTCLTDTQVGIWEQRNKCELQEMRDVRLEMSVKRLIDVSDIKGRDFAPR